jgi:hypothetical protein
MIQALWEMNIVTIARKLYTSMKKLYTQLAKEGPIVATMAKAIPQLWWLNWKNCKIQSIQRQQIDKKKRQLVIWP